MNDTVQTEDLEKVDITNPEPEAPEAKTEEPVKADETEGEVPKQSRSQNAKQRLRRKLHEAEAEKQRILEEKTAQEERLATLEKKLEGVINPPAPRPNRVDFDSEEEYEDSLLDWKLAETKPQPATPEPAQPQAPQEHKFEVAPEVHENWMNQLDETTEKYDDFEDAIVSIPKESMTDAMTLTIMESKNAGEVAYFLGTNHGEAERISRLSIAAQVREIDRLGEKLKNTTSAPDPIDPINHGGDVADVVTDPLLDGVKFE